MKYLTRLLLLTLTVNMLLSLVSAKKARKHKTNLRSHHKSHEVQLVTDKNGFGSRIEHVVRRTPSVNTVNRLGAGRLQPESRVIYSSNSNTSNGPNIGWFGRKAEIVQPHIVMHHNSPISVVHETPAHVGWRNERKTVTSLNTETGKVEQSTIDNRVPIIGNLEQVKTVYKHDTRSYDLHHKRFGPIRTTISDK